MNRPLQNRNTYITPCRSDSLAFSVLTSTCLVSVACFGFKWYDSLPFQCLKIFYNRYQARLCRAVNFGSTYMALVDRDSIFSRKEFRNDLERGIQVEAMQS